MIFEMVKEQKKWRSQYAFAHLGIPLPFLHKRYSYATRAYQFKLCKGCYDVVFQMGSFELIQGLIYS